MPAEHDEAEDDHLEQQVHRAPKIEAYRRNGCRQVKASPSRSSARQLRHPREAWRAAAAGGRLPFGILMKGDPPSKARYDGHTNEQ